MTPQSNFMIVVPVDPKHETELRQLLDSMNQGPGQVDPNNALIPFAKFDTLHFARFVILDDKTTEDVRVYRLTPRSYPLYLAFLGDIDGSYDAFIDQLVKDAGPGLRKIFSLCEGFSPAADLGAWIRAHERASGANYFNWVGRTVRQTHEEERLRREERVYVRDA